MIQNMSREEKARQLRYKKPMLADFGYQAILELLNDVEEDAYGVHWYFDSEDGSDSLLNALDGNEEEAEEVKIAFADLESKCDLLRSALGEEWDIEEYFDDCTVALIGNRYESVGYDSYQEDYYSMSRYEQGLATTEAGKRIMRWTKQEMISKIGQCFGIVLAAADIKEEHDRLSAVLDVVRGDNAGILQTIKDIDKYYEAWVADGCYQYSEESKKIDKLAGTLPDKVWAE